MTKRDITDGTEEAERGRMTAHELSWSLRAVNRAAAHLDHALAIRVGLRRLDYEAMGLVMDHETNELGPAELGQRLGISTGSATELVDRLEQAGHVARSRGGSDRRRVHLVPQSAAVARILGELTPLFTALDDLATRFDDQEREAIDRYLRAAAAEVGAFTALLTAPEDDRPPGTGATRP